MSRNVLIGLAALLVGVFVLSVLVLSDASGSSSSEVDLARRVVALEQRVASLEGRGSPTGSHGGGCTPASPPEIQAAREVVSFARATGLPSDIPRLRTADALLNASPVCRESIHEILQAFKR